MYFRGPFTHGAFTMIEKIVAFLRQEDGVSAIEYGLIAALIAVAIAAVVGTVGTDLSAAFTSISAKLKP
jgi:pilus assembly protein Flp/PilA